MTCFPLSCLPHSLRLPSQKDVLPSSPPRMEDSSYDENLPRNGEEIPNRRDVYTVVRLLGKGGYGAVYEVTRKSDLKKFAMKCETREARKTVLPMDCKVLQRTAAIHSKHFARAVDRGRIPNRLTFLIMKLLGSNLWDLRVDRAEQKFTLNTAVKAAEQCLCAIENLHRAGFLHRDIKPGNFAIGRKEDNENHVIFLLDFGLCRKFADQGKDIRLPRDVAPFRGTTRYAPLSAMRCKEQSRKDDIEGWLYMIIEWTGGGLPWAHFRGENRDNVLKMKDEARENEPSKERVFRGCPRKYYEKIMVYIDSLSYVDIPDYKYVHIIITSIYKTYHISEKDALDWDPGSPYTALREIPGDGIPSGEDPKGGDPPDV